MLKQLRTGLWLLFCVILLTTCTGVAPAPELGQDKPPPAITTCTTAPAKPAGSATQRGVAVWAVELYYAWADCFAKLKAVRDYYN